MQFNEQGCLALTSNKITMCNKLLLCIYSLSVSRGRERVVWLEDFIGKAEVISEDDVKNEVGICSALFSIECIEHLEKLYLNAMKEMHGIPYEQCDDNLEALIFLQEIVAVALWKYHQHVSLELESFAREFDRLDVSAERFRLYQKAQ